MATTDFEWTGFRALVKRVDDLLGSGRDDAEFAQDLRRALTFAYTAGITMPSAGEVYDAAGGDEFWNDAVKLDTALGIRDGGHVGPGVLLHLHTKGNDTAESLDENGSGKSLL